MTGRPDRSSRMGLLSPRYAFVLNPYVRERFARCPTCETLTRVRKLPLVIHVTRPDGARLILLNKSCRLCLRCETLVVHRDELHNAIIKAGLCIGQPDYVVLGTLDRHTWRRGLQGDVQLADVRRSMADFKKYLRVEVTPAHWVTENPNAG